MISCEYCEKDISSEWNGSDDLKCRECIIDSIDILRKQIREDNFYEITK